MTDTNTAEREALMDLIDAYAEARHVGGCHTYNAKTAEARAKVVASLAASAGSEPVAYAVFAENGNIRVWATEPQHVKRIAAEQGLKLVKLYTHPSPPEGMAGWKPIETAPKDGTELILRCGNRVGAAMWVIWPAVGERELEAGEGWTVGLDGYLWDGEGLPSHWQPMPAPPLESEVKGEGNG